MQQEAPSKVEFINVLQKNELTQNQPQEEKKQKPIRKLKVKALKGSPYVISLEDADVVGEGSFGKVVRAYDMINKNEDLVAKIIPLDDQQKYESMQMELKVLCKLPQHMNLVNYKKIKMSSQNKQYFIMDYCNGGTLTQYLKNQKKLSESEILEFLQQFCRGYRVLYKEGIIHRDIKPDNILIHNRVFKIADFGLAKIVDTLQIQNISTRGTPLYIAPELVRKEKASAKVDMWSLGVILFRMLFKGQYPFLDPLIKYDVPTALKHIQQKKLIIPSTIQRSKEIIDLIKRMLEKDESKRISWEELFNHNLVQFSLNQEEMEEECEDLNDFEDPKSGRRLMKSSVFIKKMEVIKQSKIHLTRLDQNENANKNNIQNPLLQKGKYSFDKDSDSSQEDNKQENNNNNNNTNQNDLKINFQQLKMKSVQTIIKHSQKRLKTTAAIIKMEDILLNYREKVLFIDIICLRASIMKKLVEKQVSKDIFERYSILTQKGIILLLEMGMIYNKQLENFQPEQNKNILKEEWDEFIMSENLLSLNKLFKQDKNSLLIFQKQHLEEKESVKFDKENYSKIIKKYNMTELLDEIQDNFYELLKLFNEIYEQMGDYKKGFLILFNYIFQAYSLNSEDCIFHNFTRFQDYWAYYEDVEQNETEFNLYSSLIQNIHLL